ncbi:hypothetical protein ACHAWF_008635 [Thalassiosira exigua]
MPTQEWWSTTKAKNLFGIIDPQDEAANESIFAVVENRIIQLRKGYSKAGGWREVVGGEDKDKKLCTENDVFQIQIKCRYLALALTIAQENMPNWTWMRCIEEAVTRLNELDGVEYMTSAENVRIWHLQFRRQHESFNNPQVVRSNGKPLLPYFLENNPEAKARILSWSKENLDTLSQENLRTFIIEVLIPDMVREANEELRKGNATRDESDSELGPESDFDEKIAQITEKDILKENGLQTICPRTVYKWMEALGFKYEARRKHFYVDGHEKPEVKKYRKGFVKRYLEREVRMHRWLSLPAYEVRQMIADGELEENQGYQYTDSNGEQLIEFHVDDHETFIERGAQLHPFGGNLSVRKPAGRKPLIVVGQDEAIFKQFLNMWKAWKLPDGTMAIMPKDDGNGVMISAWVSRELGFGVDWTSDLMERVNRSRAGKKYIDEEAARRVIGKPDKPPLTSSPLVKEFEYGANNEGYWNYDHMMIQVEDCVDVLREVLPAHYDIVLMVDHSCGHDRHRPDGLSVKNVNKYFGGAKPKMRDTKLDDQACFGPFPRTVAEFEATRKAAELKRKEESQSPSKKRRKKNATDSHDVHDAQVETAAQNQIIETKLEVGSTQSLVFKATDVGPWWMTAEERERRRYDIDQGTKTKDKTKEELTKELREKGVQKKGKLSELQALAVRNGISIEKTVAKVQEGWVDKPKGSLQILFERGHIDPSVPNPKEWYTEKGRADQLGILIPGSSLRQLMEEQPDFIEEETLLQFNARRLGVEIERSPKCHPEVAGEGIEYNWGCAKNAYRRYRLKEKKGKEKFRALVQECLSRDNMSLVRQRMFSRRARRYILAYHALEAHNHELTKSEMAMSASLIEKVVKKFKTHRSAADFDAGFINSIVNSMKGIHRQIR